MTRQQVEQILKLISVSLGDPDLAFDSPRAMHPFVSMSMFHSIKFKRWKLKYLHGGRVFIFHGKQKIPHTLIFLYTHNRADTYFGINYWKRSLGYRSYFYRPLNKVSQLLNIPTEYLINSRCHERYICTDSSEEVKNGFFEMLAKDFTESLGLNNDCDIERFRQTLNLIGIQNL